METDWIEVPRIGTALEATAGQEAGRFPYTVSALQFFAIVIKLAFLKDLMCDSVCLLPLSLINAALE